MSLKHSFWVKRAGSICMTEIIHTDIENRAWKAIPSGRKPEEQKTMSVFLGGGKICSVDFWHFKGTFSVI